MNRSPSSVRNAGVRRIAIIGLAAVAGFAVYALPQGAQGAPEGASAASSRAVVAEGRAAPSLQDQVLAGRSLVIHHGCGDCHGGVDHPGAPVWLSGWEEGFPPDVGKYLVGPFTTYARNLTPDNATGLGRFSERQIFNALRFGLRPGETPDVEITSHTPGQGNFPASPKYLAPPMPWPVFRHMNDDELRAIAAYLKHGLMPVENRVPDSEGPPDFWAEAWAGMVGPYPSPAFPTANERQPQD
jgi:mono/diheme cytochrome c family protein